MAKLADLLAQKAALDKKIEEMRRAERADAIARIRTLMAEYGLTAADLGAAPVRDRSKGAKGVVATAAAGAAAATTGEAGSAALPRLRRASRKGQPLGKVAPKFRDPSSGATWSGRGLKPKWLQAALDAGRTLDEFRI